MNSCSRENFAANLTRELFTDEERMNSNVSGKCGKKKLNKDLVQVVYNVVFREYPVGASEKSERCWAKCIRPSMLQTENWLLSNANRVRVNKTR